MTHSKTEPAGAAKFRDRQLAKGLRPAVIWIPDIRDPAYRAHLDAACRELAALTPRSRRRGGADRCLQARIGMVVEPGHLRRGLVPCEYRQARQLLGNFTLRHSLGGAKWAVNMEKSMAPRQHDMNLRNPDRSGRGEVRHVSATVSRVFPDRYSHDGAEHQHIWIDRVQALDGGCDYAGNVFVAIRITEGGVGQDIVFQDGTPVEMQGDWIPTDEATAGEDDPGLPVLHFTHRPVGFVRYEGEEYE